jgi:hypothetical protein
MVHPNNFLSKQKSFLKGNATVIVSIICGPTNSRQKYQEKRCERNIPQKKEEETDSVLDSPIHLVRCLRDVDLGLGNTGGFSNIEGA